MPAGSSIFQLACSAFMINSKLYPQLCHAALSQHACIYEGLEFSTEQRRVAPGPCSPTAPAPGTASWVSRVTGLCYNAAEVPFPFIDVKCCRAHARVYVVLHCCRNTNVGGFTTVFEIVCMTSRKRLMQALVVSRMHWCIAWRQPSNQADQPGSPSLPAAFKPPTRALPTQAAETLERMNHKNLSTDQCQTARSDSKARQATR